MKSARKSIQAVFFLIGLILLSYAIMLTIGFEAKFNPDLRVTKIVMNEASNVNFFDSIGNNSFVFYILHLFYILFDLDDNTLLVYCFYVIGQILIVGFLLKMVNPFNAVLVLLFVFFTIILNQIRFGLSLLVIVNLLVKQEKGISISNGRHLFYIVVATLCHLSVGAYYLIYLAVKKYVYWLLIPILLLVAGIPSILAYTEESRYIFYFTEEAERGSFTFVFLLLFYIVLYKYLQKGERFFFLIMLVLTLITYNLPSFSARICEMSIVFLFITTSQKKLSPIAKINLFTFTLFFFTYRSVLWFVLDRVPEPN